MRFLVRQLLDLAQLASTNASGIGDADRIDSQFGDVALMLDVNVWRFVSVCRIEEKPVGPAPRNSRHVALRECKPSGPARKPHDRLLLTPVLITSRDSRAYCRSVFRQSRTKREHPRAMAEKPPAA
jgi:hypothetical protein